MKRLVSILLTMLLLLGLTACGGGAADTAGDQTGTGADDPAAAGAPETDAGPEENSAAPGTEETEDRVLVVVFSATGTTRGVAEKIASITGAELYEIRPAQAYTDADLDWHDSGSRTTLEQNDKSARPAIGGEPVSLEGYATVFIGYPIWWGEEPRILDTFVESHAFDGITVIPFCTSGGSGIGRSGQNLADNAGSGNWLEGRRFSGSVSEEDLRAWIEGLAQ
ncbi:MAG: flavodoxin [Ruminococcaceae bacterium]|nr:flavodoxin [Oscillospiraceae bacterium]